MPYAPQGFTEARWHISASNDAGVDHALHPRQYVVTCEWCPAVFFGKHKADAIRQLDAHREAIYGQYMDEYMAEEAARIAALKDEELADGRQ